MRLLCFIFCTIKFKNQQATSFAEYDSSSLTDLLPNAYNINWLYKLINIIVHERVYSLENFLYFYKKHMN